MKILVINAGSSSLKYQLIDMENEQLLAKGLCERIGIDGHLKHTPMIEGKTVFNEDLPLPTHSEAIAAVIEKLTCAEHGVVNSMKEIDAVGHRVVHGGEYFADSVVIDENVIKLKEVLEMFSSESLSRLDEAKAQLDNAQNVMKKGGTPVAAAATIYVPASIWSGIIA